LTRKLDNLDAKMRFVESLIQGNTNSSKRIEDFLKPKKHKRRIKLAIFEETDEPKSKRVFVASADSLTPIVRLLRTYNRDRPGSSSGNDVPDWAKLALASSNPNSKHKIQYY